jgi:hypothetical protein
MAPEKNTPKAYLRAIVWCPQISQISDAVADLGRPKEIGKVFAGFQEYFYRDAG